MRRLTLVALALSPMAAATARAEGMPQLDFGNPLTTAQVVWGALIFAVLYIVLRNFALPTVAGVLEDRAARIRADLGIARQAKAQADAAVRELTQATAKARAEAQDAIATATAEARAEAAQRDAALAERLDAQLAEAERRIDDARTSAMAALRQVAREASEAMLTRLAGQSPDPGVLDGAIGRSLSARGLS